MIEIDKNTRRLIIFNLYVLFSLVSAGIIHEIFKDHFNEIYTPILIGLVISLIALIYFLKFCKFISKYLNHEGETS